MGSDNFVAEMQSKIDPNKNFMNIPQSQYSAQSHSLEYYEKQSINRNQCIKMAYDSGGFSLAEIALHFGLHYSRVSRIIKKLRLGNEKTLTAMAKGKP